MHFMSLCLCERVEAINTSLAIQPILVVASRKAHTDTIYFTGLRNTAKLLISCTCTHVWLVCLCVCMLVFASWEKGNHILSCRQKTILIKTFGLCIFQQAL